MHVFESGQRVYYPDDPVVNVRPCGCCRLSLAEETPEAV